MVPNHSHAPFPVRSSGWGIIPRSALLQRWEIPARFAELPLYPFMDIHSLGLLFQPCGCTADWEAIRTPH